MKKTVQLFSGKARNGFKGVSSGLHFLLAIFKNIVTFSRYKLLKI